MASSKKEHWTESDVLCPFYISGDRPARTLKCEGYSDGTSVISAFRSTEAREKHMGMFCVGRYERCPLYRCTYGAKYDD